MSEGAQDGALRLDPESIEALARRLAELLSPREEPSRPRRQLLTAEEVARWWGIGRRWVYDHADELGARRLGGGRRPRLRFDPDEVAERLGEPSGQDGLGPMSGDRRRCAAIALLTRFPRGAELSSVGKQENGRGGARTPPDPAPNRPAQ